MPGSRLHTHFLHYMKVLQCMTLHSVYDCTIGCKLSMINKVNEHQSKGTE